MIILQWTEGDSKGYRDYLPTEWFAHDGTSASPLRHDVVGRGESGPAVCSVAVNGREAVLDYGGPNSSINRRNDIYPGQIKIIFSNKARNEIVRVDWRNEGVSEFERAPVVASFRDDVSLEGDQRLVAHLRRERDRGLVNKKVQGVLSSGRPLKCEACGFDFEATYGRLGTGFCEVHHLVPMTLGERETRLSDLAVLCANCHRMIHRTKPMIDVKEFASKYLAAKN